MKIAPGDCALGAAGPGRHRRAVLLVSEISFAIAGRILRVPQPARRLGTNPCLPSPAEQPRIEPESDEMRIAAGRGLFKA
jgi:hypothetical protein